MMIELIQVGIASEKTKKAVYSSYNLALRKGLLIKKPCIICGTSERIEGHHFDYSKPLEVIWMCKKDHMELHAHHRRENLDKNSISARLRRNEKEISLLLKSGKSIKEVAELMVVTYSNLYGFARKKKMLKRKTKKFDWARDVFTVVKEIGDDF
jgi:hypothetical protein